MIVLAAERLPVLETLELQHKLAHSGVQVECLIVNKRSPNTGGQFLKERHAQEAQHLKLLDEKLPSVPRQEIELMAHDVVGLKALEAFSHKLG